MTLIYVAVAFIQSVLLARYLGVYEFGIFATLFGISVIISQLTDPRFMDFLIKTLTKYEIESKHKDSQKLIISCWLIAIIICCISCLIILAIEPLILNLFVQDYKDYIYSFPLVLITTFVSTHFFTIFQAVFRSKGKIKELSIFSITFHLSKILSLFLYLYLFEVDLFGAILCLAIVNLFFMILMFIVVSKEFLFNLNYRDSLKSALIYFVKERGLILSLYSSSIASIPQKEMDIFFFGIFTKPETVGIYRMAKNFTVALWAIVDGLVLLLFPEIIKLNEKKNWIDLKVLIVRVLKFGFITGILLVASGYIFLPFIIDILLSEEFKDSYYYSMILFAGAIVWLPLSWVYPFAISSAASKTIAYSTLMAGCISSLLYYVFSNYFFSYGIAIVYAISPGLASITLLLFLKRFGAFRNLSNTSR